MEQPTDSASTTITARRAVGLTLAAVIGMIVLAGAVVGVFLVYHHEAKQVSRYKTQVATVKHQLAAAQAQATSSFNRGMKLANSIQASSGNTYAKGYKDGWAGAFSGFGGWEDGSWYVVQISHGANGHNIQYRVAVTPCQRMYESNDQIYTQGNAC